MITCEGKQLPSKSRNVIVGIRQEGPTNSDMLPFLWCKLHCERWQQEMSSDLRSNLRHQLQFRLVIGAIELISTIGS
uniref:Uncharacterized protein n=1 Tax=Arundo donax TaxID=35708 RepID=A0A0A9DNR3_ARUDO